MPLPPLLMDDRYWWKLPDDVDASGYAEEFVNASLLPDVGVAAENRAYLWDKLEKDWFRPVLELEVAGLCLLAGPLGKRTFAGSFSCFVFDHLVMGWNSILISHPRVAYTLSRHVVEASIFQAADVVSPDWFRNQWQNKKPSGGAVLKHIKRHLPHELRNDLDRCWKFVVSFMLAQSRRICPSFQDQESMEPQFTP